MKTFKTIEQLNKAIEKANGQLTFEMLLNQRAPLGKGWEYFNISDEVKREIVSHVVNNILGGWKVHRPRIEYILNNTPLSHWGLQRILFRNGRWSYYAGQDYTSELRQIREYIRK